jgi:hypothetical protein
VSLGGGGGVSQAISRDVEAYMEKFIPVYNKTMLANMCPLDDKLMFSIKILLLDGGGGGGGGGWAQSHIFMMGCTLAVTHCHKGV